MFGALVSYIWPDSSSSSSAVNSSYSGMDTSSDRETRESSGVDAKMVTVSSNLVTENPIEAGLKQVTQEVKIHNTRIKDTETDSHDKYARIARDLSGDIFKN